MHWREVALQYLKFWFIIDFVSSLPPEAFEGFSENSVVKGKPQIPKHKTPQTPNPKTQTPKPTPRPVVWSLNPKPLQFP